MSKNKTTKSQQQESNAWIVAMVFVVVAVVIAVVVAIWHQHRELSGYIPQPTAIEYRVHH